MDLKKLREELKKANDPEKYLRELLKKTKDKKLIALIKQVLEKKKSYGESSLERTVRNTRVNVPRREPELATVEVAEEEATRVGVRPDLVVGAKQNEDYGGSAGSKGYKTGSIVKQLEESHLVASGGHLGNAETKGLMDKKIGEYEINKNAGNYGKNGGEYREAPKQESFVEESMMEEALTHGEKEAKKKKLGDYV